MLEDNSEHLKNIGSSAQLKRYALIMQNWIQMRFYLKKKVLEDPWL